MSKKQSASSPRRSSGPIKPDAEAKTLTIADNGIGMDRQELVDNLGTLARSGTKAFLKGLKDAKDGLGLIGQFGVGFYAAFMVADRIEVTSRRAGSNEAWTWTSASGAGFEVAPATEEQAARVARGTEIVLHLKEDAVRYLQPYELERIVRTYSDHVLFPIELIDDKGEARQVNAASALWQRSKSEVKPEDYTQAYRSLAMAFDEPALTLHYKVEGRQSYAVLLFVPSTPPFDLTDPARKGRVKLYVRRVFIADDAQLLPPYLRFVRGVIDSAPTCRSTCRARCCRTIRRGGDPQGGDQPRALGTEKMCRERQPRPSARSGRPLRRSSRKASTRTWSGATSCSRSRASPRPRVTRRRCDQGVRGRPEAQPDGDLLSRGRQPRPAEVESRSSKPYKARGMSRCCC
jgi:hypothetical protein